MGEGERGRREHRGGSIAAFPPVRSPPATHQPLPYPLPLSTSTPFSPDSAPPPHLTTPQCGTCLLP